MDIEKELQSLGFTPNEVRIYLTLLRLGQSKAGRLSTECNLERTSTYNAIKKLQENGMVSSIREGKIQVYYAAEPEHILDVFKEKQERAQLLIPSLKTMRKWEKQKENIIKFRGYMGIRTVLYDILNECNQSNEYLTFGSEGQLSERMPTFSKIFVAQKDRKKILSRLIMHEQPFGKKMSRYTKVRYVPKYVLSPAVTTVYKDKVAIILWTVIPEAIIIDNKDAAESYRSYFEFMWKHAHK